MKLFRYTKIHDFWTSGFKWIISLIEQSPFNCEVSTIILRTIDSFKISDKENIGNNSIVYLWHWVVSENENLRRVIDRYSMCGRTHQIQEWYNCWHWFKTDLLKILTFEHDDVQFLLFLLFVRRKRSSYCNHHTINCKFNTGIKALFKNNGIILDNNTEHKVSCIFCLFAKT